MARGPHPTGTRRPATKSPKGSPTTRSPAGSLSGRAPSRPTSPASSSSSGLRDRVQAVVLAYESGLVTADQREARDRPELTCPPEIRPDHMVAKGDFGAPEKTVAFARLCPYRRCYGTQVLSDAESGLARRHPAVRDARYQRGGSRVEAEADTRKPPAGKSPRAVSALLNTYGRGVTASMSDSNSLGQGSNPCARAEHRPAANVQVN